MAFRIPPAVFQIPKRKFAGFWIPKAKRFQNPLTLYFKKNWKECSSIQGVQHMVVITKLRFPCRCIRANVRYHWLLGSARAQPWICFEALFFGGGGGGVLMSLVWISSMVIYRWSNDLYSWPVKCDLYFRPGRTSVCIKHPLLCMF